MFHIILKGLARRIQSDCWRSGGDMMVIFAFE